MRLICPCCGAQISAEAALVDGDARATVAALASLGALAETALRYLALHRKPDAKTGLPWRKARRLAEELRDLVQAEDIQWKGKRILCNATAHWRQALEDALARAEAGKLERPLDGHNYLRAIAYDHAAKAADASHKAKERACARRADAPEEGVDRRTRKEDAMPQKVTPGAALENIRKIKDKLKGGGHGDAEG